MKFEMLKPDFTANVWALILAVIPVVIVIFVVIMVFSAWKYTLEIKDGQLTIKSLFYNTRLDIADIDAAGAKVVSLKRDGIKIKWRTNGIGLPGLSVGWFRGEGGKYKMYVTDQDQVLLLPTRKGYTILFSTGQGAAIIKELRQAQGLL
ncbi:MAG: PH domain-containing protein [Bacillota bacterium]